MMACCFNKNEVESNQSLSSSDLGEATEDIQVNLGDEIHSRRRKGLSKPRRISQTALALQANSNKSDKNLLSVLERVLKAKQIGQQQEEFSEISSDMIDIHETLPIHHHSKAVTVSAPSPTSVDSPQSLYLSEKSDDLSAENVTSNDVSPFVKIRRQSSDDVTAQVLYSVANEMQRKTSEERQSVSPVRRSPIDNRSQEVPEINHRSLSSHSTSPTHVAPVSYLQSSAYERLNPTSAIVAMAAGMGLPTMIPSNSVMTSSVPAMTLQQPQMNGESSRYSENKRSDSSFSRSGRGIVGSNGGLSSSCHSPTPEERAQFKRPPHTYPALIASAILDSPGNLITLRGIYEYIMNKFPYYKYCHDKSAWQNSIRHNLSLNQCFIKVPRYENAAKSNYWTMTREGFEEFGNENSFKRRRRRAALTPISTYKTKKQSEGSKNGGKNKVDVRSRAAGNEADYSLGLSSQIMGLASRKRSLSPTGQEAAKQQKMMILKQGDGPAISGGAEESAFTSAFSKIPSKADPAQFLSNPWAAKNLMMSSIMRRTSSPEKTITENIYKDTEKKVTIDGVEVGTKTALQSESSEMLVCHFRCRFCPYAYVSTSGIVLEQHARMLHQIEIASAKAKTNEKLQEEADDATKRLMLQNLMSGLSSASMIAAAQSNATNLLAASQSSVGNAATDYPYSAGNFASGLFNDDVIRSIAGRTTASQSNAVEAYQRQQALNSALQQAAAVAVSTPSVASQDQLRLLYQQVAMNPFLASSSVFHRQAASTETEEPNQIQQLWQYQQKLISHMKALSERNSPNQILVDQNATQNGEQVATEARSPSNSPSYVGADLKRTIHGWKQCSRCGFTAKGDHGLELHYRKAHPDVMATSPVNDDTFGRAHLHETINANDASFQKRTSEAKFEQHANIMASSAFPTPPLSNSPSYVKGSFTPLDLSGPKDTETVKGTSYATASTQTSEEDATGSRSCEHCNITFGDEMMHALHMSCHDKNDPFQCKVCGVKCKERYFFNVHLLRGMHHHGESSDSPNFVPDSSTEALDDANSADLTIDEKPCTPTNPESAVTTC